MIRPFKRGLTKKARELLNYPLRALAHGVHVDSADVIGEQFEDGRMRLALAKFGVPVSSPAPPPACECPEGLADVYCVSPVDPPGAGAICTTGDCTWHGVTACNDLAQTWDLSLSDDFDGLGNCGWILSLDNGDVIYSKPFDDGNPAGTYTGGDGSVTVTACEEECISCECPCSDFVNWTDGDAIYLQFSGTWESIWDDTDGDNVRVYTSGSGTATVNAETCEITYDCTTRVIIYDSDLNVVSDETTGDCTVLQETLGNHDELTRNEGEIDPGATFGTYGPDGIENFAFAFTGPCVG